MLFSLIIMCTALSMFSCEAATLDYSNITPWSVVYTVYPVYESEPWVDVSKNERSLDISDNTIHFGSNDRQRSNLNIHKELPDNNDSRQINHSNNRDNQQLNSNQQTQSHLWPLNYKNWPKNSNIADH